jgi:serine/threonine-protein kinase
VLLYLSLLVVAALFARRNIRLGRADLRGAFRIAAVIFTMALLAWGFRTHHAWAQEARTVVVRISTEFFQEGFFWWLLLVALEPHARRMWPELLVSWNRLLRGNYRDPRVGRDLLLGGAGAVLIHAVFLLGHFSLIRAGFVPDVVPPPNQWPLIGLAGIPQSIGAFFYLLKDTFSFPMFVLMMLVATRAILRSQWVALLATAAVPATIVSLFNPFGGLMLGLLTFLYFLALLLFVIRFGFLAALAYELVSAAATSIPTTWDPSSWYFGRSVTVFLLIAALFVFAYRCSTGGRSLIRGGLIPD